VDIGSVEVTGSSTSGWAYGYRFKSTNSTVYGGLWANGNANAAVNYYTVGPAYNVGLTVLNSNGNVGIGTTSPSATLVVSNGGAAGIELQPEQTTDTNRILNYDRATATYMDLRIDANAHQFMISGTERMRIDSGGNVGIGTTSPSEKLTVHSTATAIASFYTTNSSGGFTSYQNSTGGVKGFVGYGATLFGAGFTNSDFGLRAQENIALSTNGANVRLFIDSTGAIKFNSYDSTNNTGTPTYLLGTDASGNVVKTNTVPGSAAGPYLPLAGGTMSGNLELAANTLNFADNGKARFGNSTDLQIYHDGSNSYINEVGTGDLYLQTNGTNMFLRDSASGNTFIAMNIGTADVSLRQNGNIKLTTTSTGVTVTGNVGMSTGNSAGKFAVMSTSVHGSYDFYNNGTSYLNGAVTVDDAFTQSGGAASTFSGTLTVTGVTTLANVGYLGDGLGSVQYTLQSSNTGYATIDFGDVADVNIATFAGTVTAPTFLGDLNGTINTVTTAVTKANSTNDTTVATTAFVQNLIGTIPAGLVFQGTWNAATNTPTLTSGTGTTGNFYIVSVDGSTNLDGITDWKVGDWAVFVEQGASDQWEKVDNSSVLDGSGTGQTVALWSGSGTSNTLTDAPITVSGNDTTFAGTINSGYITSTGLQVDGGIINYQQGDTYADGLQFLRTGATRANIWLNSANNTLNITRSLGTVGMAIDSSGNVGIGTTSPSKKLEVVSNTTYDGIQISGASIPTLAIIDTTNNAKLVAYVRDSDATIGMETNHPLTINTNNTERMRITSGGDVGIGTTSPSYKLDVEGSIRANNSSGNSSMVLGSGGSCVMDLLNAQSEAYLRTTTAHDLHFRTDNVNRMVVKAAGNVGIGTTSPQSKLQVAGGIQMADDTDTAVAAKVGTMRYRTGTEYVEVDGVELVTNGDFATDTDWTKGTGWTISGGFGVGNLTTNNYGGLKQSPTLSVGAIYRYQFTISSYTSGSVRFAIGSTDNGTSISGNGVYSGYITYAAPHGSGSTIAIFAWGNFVGSVDNVSVLEVTAEDASYADMCMQTGASTYEWVNIVRNTY
jgi:hypothetical protein